VNQLFLKKDLWNKSSQKMVYGTIFLKILVYETILFQSKCFMEQFFISQMVYGTIFLKVNVLRNNFFKENGLWNNLSQEKWFLWNLGSS